MSDIKVNRKYKDRLFRLRFGGEECKKDMLSLYNAINGTAYVVFYNGDGDGEAVTELKLSDAFMNKSKGGFEWTAVVYNLNRGKNDKLLEQCRPLSEYMELINRIQDNQKSGMNVKTAVNAAVDSCIEDGIMKAFLTKHRAEVMSMCLTEFDEKVFVDGLLEEGEARGKAKATIELLEDYGEIPERIRKLIMDQTDFEILKKWLKLAARAESIEDFEEKIGLVKES